MTAYAPLRALFTEAGYGFVEPPILHDANVFVELAGEDLRRRLFLTQAADGAEMALRPDFTIPVCLHHLATGPAQRRADYAYLGPVFRQRRDEASEFVQAGVEIARPHRPGRRRRRHAGAGARRRRQPRRRTPARPDRRLRPLRRRPRWPRPRRRRGGGASPATFGDTERLARDDRPAQRQGRPGSRRGGDQPHSRPPQAVEDACRAGLGTIGGRTADEIAGRGRREVRARRRHRRAAGALLGRFLEVSGRRAAGAEGPARPRSAAARSTCDQGARRFRGAARRLRRRAASISTGSSSPPISAGGSTTIPASSSRSTTRPRRPADRRRRPLRPARRR